MPVHPTDGGLLWARAEAKEDVCIGITDPVFGEFEVAYRPVAEKNFHLSSKRTPAVPDNPPPSITANDGSGISPSHRLNVAQFP